MKERLYKFSIGRGKHKVTAVHEAKNEKEAWERLWEDHVKGPWKLERTWLQEICEGRESE